MNALVSDYYDPPISGMIDQPRGWTKTASEPGAWRLELPQTCLGELDAAVFAWRRDPQPLALLCPERLELAACARFMAGVREQLRHGIGLSVIDRIPVERYRLQENQLIAWLLGGLLLPVVPQKYTGSLLYDVKDSGRKLGYGVRRSITNLGQDFHTDGAWLWMPPEFVGLFCLQHAAEGGVSRFVSLGTVHDQLSRERPDALERLYRPFYWDRQAEHGPDDAKVSRHPVFQPEGRTLFARYYEDYNLKGHELAGEPLDEAGREALRALRAIIHRPDNWMEFTLERGQLQYINNRRFAHGRTPFSDGRGAQRHLIRIWNRAEGSGGFEG